MSASPNIWRPDDEYGEIKYSGSPVEYALSLLHCGTTYFATAPRRGGLPTGVRIRRAGRGVS